METKEREAFERLVSCNNAERYQGAKISEQTRAALFAVGRVQDALDCLINLHELMYCEIGDEANDAICEAAAPLQEMADKYLLLSIKENLGSIRTPEETVI